MKYPWILSSGRYPLLPPLSPGRSGRPSVRGRTLPAIRPLSDLRHREIGALHRSPPGRGSAQPGAPGPTGGFSVARTSRTSEAVHPCRQVLRSACAAVWTFLPFLPDHEGLGANFAAWQSVVTVAGHACGTLYPTLLLHRTVACPSLVVFVRKSRAISRVFSPSKHFSQQVAELMDEK